MVGSNGPLHALGRRELVGLGDGMVGAWFVTKVCAPKLFAVFCLQVEVVGAHRLGALTSGRKLRGVAAVALYHICSTMHLSSLAHSAIVLNSPLRRRYRTKHQLH